MAGKLRLKVVLEDESYHVQPFWMFADREESPLIINIAEQINTRLKKVKVKSLYLDGCLLPTNETSELLRDNDVVHVHVTGKKRHEDEAAVVALPQVKNHKKRKLSDTNDASSPNVKKKKSSKEKLRYDSKKRKNKKQNEKPKKVFTEKQLDHEADKNDELLPPGISVPSVANTIETENKISSTQTPGDRESSEMEGLVVNSTPVTDTPCVEKPKKRRRRKKDKKRSDAQEKSIKTPVFTKQATAELRLPKGQQGQNKRIVFSSEDESVEESGTGALENQGKAVDESQDVSSLLSAQRVSDYSSSFIESTPPSRSLNLPKVDLIQRVVAAGTKSANTNQDPDMSVRGNVNGEGMNRPKKEVENGVGEEDEWYRAQQYQEKLNEESDMRRKVPSALDKAVTPVHLYTGGYHQVVQPNLSEYLKMSPEERGVTVPPYVKARRLSNGAMLYTRSPTSAGAADQKTASPMFKKPAAYSPARAFPHKPSKQQQLGGISTNTSVISRKSSSSPAVSVEDIKSGIPSTEEGPKNTLDTEDLEVDSAETVVLTPVREYSLFADLRTSPKVGDLIAYKVLEMGEDYTPGISDYKEAEVWAYDASTQNVTVKLTQRRPQKKAVGKFDLPDESPEEIEVTLELSSMFEPKLISSQERCSEQE
ncbi:hypothetical protein ACOMHN_009970 [Nucella lapillus]